MQKAVRHGLAVLGRILFIGLSIQIVLGMVWMFCNVTGFQKFGESRHYIEVSKSLLCDEYTGALYPVLLMLVRGIEGVLRIPYTYVLYLLQVLAAVGAAYGFLRAAGVKKRRWAVWGSLALLTLPMAMQCHLAVLPHSLTSSCFLLEMAFLLRAVKTREAIPAAELAKMSLCWLLCTLLMPDYRYLGALPVLLLLGYELLPCKGLKNWQTQGKRLLYHAILLAAFAGMIVGVEGLTQQEGYYGRPQKSVDAALFRRVAWTSLLENYEEWPKEMQACFSYDEAREIASCADNMESMLQAKLEEAVGAERARELYRELGAKVWKSNYPAILRDMVWDAAGYAVPPVAVQLFLAGRGYESFVGRNYEIMRFHAPEITRWYVDYSGWWFAVGIGVAAIMEILLAATGQRRKGFPVAACILSAGVMIIWYTLSGAGVWDYKNGLFIGQLWLTGMILLCVQTVEEY